MMVVSEFTGISVDDIKSRKRTGDVCEARSIFIYLSSSMYGKNAVSIGRYINRSHQSVLSQIKTIDQHLRIYKGFNIKVKKIKDAIVQL
jgi:chromosomal replication initiation ATPase DnaA